MSIYISHLYIELDISVSVASFDVIFSEKFIIGESGDFLWIFVFIQEESGLDCGFEVKKTVVIYCLTSYYLFGFTTI